MYIALYITFQNSPFCCNGVSVYAPRDSKDQNSYFPKEHYPIGTFSEDGVSFFQLETEFLYIVEMKMKHENTCKRTCIRLK